MALWASGRERDARFVISSTFLDFCRNGSLLCENNATCVNRPDISDFACDCPTPYYDRYCERCSLFSLSLLRSLTSRCFLVSVGLTYRLLLVNYSNLTSPGVTFLTSVINQTIVNITRDVVFSTSIIIIGKVFLAKSHPMNITSVDFSPAGDVTLSVIGTNLSVPQFNLALINRANTKWTAGPYLVLHNQSSLAPFQSS